MVELVSLGIYMLGHIVLGIQAWAYRLGHTGLDILQVSCLNTGSKIYNMHAIVLTA